VHYEKQALCRGQQQLNGYERVPVGGTELNKEIILQELSARRQELLNEVIPHFRSGNAERGRIAFRRWKERFADFLRVHIPTETSHFEAAMTHYAFAVSPGEHPYDMFMREDGNTCLAIIDDLADSIQKGRIINPNKKAAKPAPRKTQSASSSPKTPRWVWIPALVFASLLGAFLILTYFLTPAMTSDQKSLVHLFSALLASFAATFIGGTALVQLELPQNNSPKVILSATAGIAVFALVYYLNPPPPTNYPEIEYTGRVVDTETNKAIHNAKVSIQQDKRIPEVYQTDSEGVFHLSVLASPKEVRLRVEAAGYEVFDRLVTLSRTGIEDIRLTKTSGAASPETEPTRVTNTQPRVTSPSPLPAPTPSHISTTKPSWDLIEGWVRQSFSEGTPIERVKKVDDPECTNGCQKAIAVLKDSSNASFDKRVTVTYEFVNGQWRWNVKRD